MDRMYRPEKAKNSDSARKADLDLDDEYEEEVSRRTSHVGLGREQKRVAEADRKPDAGKLHEASNRTSYDSVAAALELLAKQLHERPARLVELMGASVTGEAGAEPAIQQISAIYTSVRTDAEHASALIAVVDKSERTVLANEVKKVRGAFFGFANRMQQASGWVTSHGGQGGELNPRAIQKTIDDYAGQIGFEVKDLEEDRAAPDAKESTLAKQLLTTQLAAADAALESLRAGNTSEASRVVLHLRYINGMAAEHAAALKAHKSQLAALLKKLDAIRSAKSTPADVTDRLAEGHNQLVGLVK